MVSSKSVITREEFETVLPRAQRVPVVDAYNEVVERYRDQLNYNYFKAPQHYDPYTAHVGPINENLNLLPDLSRCNMSAIYFLSQLRGDHVVLDYACGVSGFLFYANRYFPSYGFDRWCQIPKAACVEFFSRLKVSQDALLEFDEIGELRPTVLNVAGYWIDDIELYQLDSVKYIISDTLYNTGSIPGEGVFHYRPDWKSTPDRFGFHATARLPGVDILRLGED